MMNVPANMVTTTLELPGYTIVKSLGVVRGISVRSLSIVGTFGANIRAIFGGNIGLYTNMCDKTRQEAFNILIAQAEALGANAITGMRYDANELQPGVTEILAYGTAVIVEKMRNL
jgi:uncharacterized protein YbjQ (UPF0145 family)